MLTPRHRNRTGPRAGSLRIAAFAILAGGCAAVPPPATQPAAVLSDAPTPIRDRYARQRLVLLEAINADRAAHGLAAVALDSVGTVVAQLHARNMAREGYLSHYAIDGSAPYERASDAGMTDHVRENVFRWTHRSEDPLDPGWPWLEFDVRRAQEWLMDSPPHQATILDASRTHVGIGIAEERDDGAVYVVQEFLARHASLDAPALAWRNSPTRVTGRMAVPGTRPLLIYLSQEPGREGRPGDPPPRGPYADGGPDGLLVPPWSIRWNVRDRSFELELAPGALNGARRWYGIVYVAPEDQVRRALGRRVVNSNDGFPGAAFVLDVL